MYIHLESVIGLILIVAILHYALTAMGALLDRLPPHDWVKAAGKRRGAPYTNQLEFIRAESKRLGLTKEKS